MFSETKKLRLKDLCIIDYGLPAKYAGNDVSVLRQGVRAVQWVGRDGIKAKLLMPDGTTHEGLVEKAVLNEKNDEVQFERIGFARIEKKGPDMVEAVFTHR